MSQVNADTLANAAATKTVPTADLVDGHCTAWVKFDGTNGTILSSFNVNSVSHDSVGNYTVNFATPMANANYSAIAQAATVGGVADGSAVHSEVQEQLVGSVGVNLYNWAGNWSDAPNNYSVVIFGGK